MFGPGVGDVLPPDDCLLRVRLPIRLTNGNKGRGGHWWGSHEFRGQCELLLKSWGLRRQPFDVPVTVTLIRVLSPREKPWDSSSWQRGNWKEIEDALVAVGWFHDDNRTWIADTQFDEITDDRSNGPAIVVEIRSS